MNEELQDDIVDAAVKEVMQGDNWPPTVKTTRHSVMALVRHAVNRSIGVNPQKGDKSPIHLGWERIRIAFARNDVDLVAALNNLAPANVSLETKDEVGDEVADDLAKLEQWRKEERKAAEKKGLLCPANGAEQVVREDAGMALIVLDRQDTPPQADLRDLMVPDEKTPLQVALENARETVARLTDQSILDRFQRAVLHYLRFTTHLQAIDDILGEYKDPRADELTDSLYDEMDSSAQILRDYVSVEDSFFRKRCEKWLGRELKL